MNMNKLELKVYNKLIKPNLQTIDEKLCIDMKYYQEIKNEKIKTIFVSCLYKKNIKMLDNGKRDIMENIIEEADDFFDDYSIMDDLIEEEIMPLANRMFLNEEDKWYDLPIVDSKTIDNLYSSKDANSYIKGYVDGRNFNVGQYKVNKSNDKLLCVIDNERIKKQRELRDKVLEILEILNSLEREIIRLKFSFKLSDKQISMYLHISEQVVDAIYKSAIVKIRNNKHIDELKSYYK